MIADIVKDVPEDIDGFFNKFVEVFTKKSYFEGNAKIEIMEIGPREKRNTFFQLMPATNMEVKFPISFHQTQSGIEVSFNLDIKMIFAPNQKKPKFGKKMLKARMDTFEAGLNNQLSILIKSALNDVKD